MKRVDTTKPQPPGPRDKLPTQDKPKTVAAAGGKSAPTKAAGIPSGTEGKAVDNPDPTKKKGLFAGLMNRVNDVGNSDESDNDSSADDDDDDDDWLTLDDNSTAVPSVTSVTVRNQILPSFLNVEEEKNIQRQIKFAKFTKKKMKKTKKLMRKQVKAARQTADINEAFLAYVNTIPPENVCLNSSVEQTLQRALSTLRAFNEGNRFTAYSESIENIATQLKAVEEHAKLLSATGKDRRNARDKRIKAESSEVDVADETQYQKKVEAINAFKDKDKLYKEESTSFKEHCSAQIFQAVRNALLESAKYHEAMAANLRQCAQLNGNGRYVPQNTVKRFSSGEDDLKKPVQLFGGLTRKLSTNSHDPVEGKPHSKNDQRVVAGIPVEPTRPYTRNYSQSPYNTPNAKPSPPLHSANYPPSSNESNYKKKMNEIRKKMGKPLDVESPLPSVTRKPSATSNSSRDSANSKYSRIEKAYRTCANKM